MDIVVSFLTIILCYFISGMVHEVGHVLVGLANGWKFLLLVIGPLGIKADNNGRIRFYLEKQVIMWGGVGCTVPKQANEDNIRIWSWVLLGGPLASIVMSIIFLPWGIITKNLVLLILGAMSLSMGIICILPLPLKTGILYTDGRRWYRLHKGGQEAAEEIALFKLTENQVVNGGFANINVNDIEPLIRSKDAAVKYYGYYYLFQYYKAMSNTEQMELALAEMAKIKDRVPSLIVNNCKIQ